MTQPTTLSQADKPKNYLGSTLLFIGIFSTATLAGLFILLAIPFSFALAYKFSAIWCHVVLWMAKVFCGVHYQVEGLEHINKDQAAIVLSNHQSAWETLALRHILPTQVVLLKRSLVWLPIWGWALGSLKSIVIDRKSQTKALRALLEKGETSLKEGLWVIVFPEGTRTEPGKVRKFSAGGAMLAQKSGFPVIPLAHNAGDCWPRYSFLKYPGLIKVKIGPSIETEGRKASDINAEAENWVRQAMMPD
jgi:1-acyl-sn-glycerol-3-phosphate acyltransferase